MIPALAPRPFRSRERFVALVGDSQAIPGQEFVPQEPRSLESKVEDPFEKRRVFPGQIFSDASMGEPAKVEIAYWPDVSESCKTVMEMKIHGQTIAYLDFEKPAVGENLKILGIEREVHIKNNEGIYGLEKCFMQSAMKLAKELGLPGVELSERCHDRSLGHLTDEGIVSLVETQQRQKVARTFTKIDRVDPNPLRFLVVDNYDDKNLDLCPDGRVNVSHGALMNGVIRRRMRELAPSQAYVIERQEVRGNECTKGLEEAIPRLESESFDGVNLSFGLWIGVHFFQLWENYNDRFIHGGNLASHREHILANAPGVISEKLGNVDLFDRAGRLVDCYFAAGNDGDSRIASSLFSREAIVVGAHGEDGYRSSYSSSNSSTVRYALGEGILRPVVEGGELQGFSLGADRQIDIPLSELNTSGLDARDAARVNLFDETLASGTSLATPCYMVENSLVKRGLVEQKE